MASARSFDGACHLNVIGRHYCYVSKSPVGPGAAESLLDVDLEPATFVMVRVATAGSFHATGGRTLFIESRLGRESASLRKELLQAPFGAQILRSTGLLLPRGTARVILWDSSAMRVLAEREVTCQSDSIDVSLIASGQ